MSGPNTHHIQKPDMQSVVSSPVTAPALYTLPQAARLLAVSKRTLERLEVRGRIKFVRIGRCVRIRAEDLAAYTAGSALSAS